MAIQVLQEEPTSDTQPLAMFYGLTGSVGNTKEEPVSEKLEEAAWLYYDKNRLPIPPELDLYREFIDFFKAGAKWMCKQMMKDAVEGFVCSQRGDMAMVKSNIFPTDLKFDDKIKLVIIKPEED